jgi:hypothetical protein
VRLTCFLREVVDPVLELARAAESEGGHARVALVLECDDAGLVANVTLARRSRSEASAVAPTKRRVSLEPSKKLGFQAV